MSSGVSTTSPFSVIPLGTSLRRKQATYLVPSLLKFSMAVTVLGSVRVTVLTTPGKNGLDTIGRANRCGYRGASSPNPSLVGCEESDDDDDDDDVLVLDVPPRTVFVTLLDLGLVSSASTGSASSFLLLSSFFASFSSLFIPSPPLPLLLLSSPSSPFPEKKKERIGYDETSTVGWWG